MRQFISVFLLFSTLFFMCGCSDNTPHIEATSETSVVITEPDDDTVNGYKSNYDNTTHEPSSPSKDAVTSGESVSRSDNSNSEADSMPSSDVYYANTKTKKFHLPSCGYAKNANNENLYVCESRDELLNDGYIPCKRCKP